MNSVYQTLQIALMGAQARGEITEGDARLASVWVDLQEALQDK